MATPPKTAPNSGSTSSAVTTAPNAAGPKQPLTPLRPAAFKITPMHARAVYLNFLVYGKYGVGKTFLAGTAAEVESMCDVLMVDAEAGALTLAHHKNIDVVTLKAFKPFARIQEFLKLHCQLRDEGKTEELIALEARLKGVDPKEIKVPRKYCTCVIDSLTEIDVYSMYKELGITDDTRLDDDIEPPGWPEYGKNFHNIQRTVRAYRDLPMHTIITCAAIYNQDDQKKLKYHPAMTGKLSGAVQGFMDVVGFLDQATDADGATVRRLFVNPSASWDAKNRFTTFKEAYFDNPTIGSILKAVGLLQQ